MFNLIVAQSKNRYIGKDNKLLWHLPMELKNFKNITRGHTVIMGRKTLESIGRPLPNRRNMVLSRQKGYIMDGIEIFSSWKDLFDAIDGSEEIFIIGGSEIYRQALDMNIVNKIYLTTVDKDFKGDAQFPVIDDKSWTLDSESLYPKSKENLLSWRFQIFFKSQ